MLSLLCICLLFIFLFVCGIVADSSGNVSYDTIIVIYGQLRTFPLTCSGIFEHIVKQNAPSRVIINIDGGESEKTIITSNKFIRACLDAYLGPVDFIIEPIHKKTALHHGMEFDLMDRAIDFIEANKFTAKYLLKVRSDNFINAPIDIGAAYGRSSSFITRFLSFQQRYQRMLADANKINNIATATAAISLGEQLWAWIFTAGVQVLIRPMLFEPSPSPWSFINATVWNHKMHDDILTHYSQPVTLTLLREFYNYSTLVTEALQDIHHRYQVVYLLGRTWVHFGPYQSIAAVSRGIVPDYGRLGWNVSDSKQRNLPEGHMWPFTGAKLAEEMHRYDIFEWREVTESQLRLEHWKLGLQLIDIQNAYDDAKSFQNEPGSVYEDMNDEKLVAFLLRKCDANTRSIRGECTGQ